MSSQTKVHPARTETKIPDETDDTTTTQTTAATFEKQSTTTDDGNKNASKVEGVENTQHSNSSNIKNILEVLRKNGGDQLSDHLADLRLLVAAAENPLDPLSKQYALNSFSWQPYSSS